MPTLQEWWGPVEELQRKSDCWSQGFLQTMSEVATQEAGTWGSARLQLTKGQVLLTQVVKGLTVEHLSLLLGRWSLPRVVVRRTSHERNDSKASRDRMEQEEPESVWEGRTSH